ncbi:MAG TPA: DUF6798 domain-containing protein [Pirellulaceae bacterium]|nr:DUF6798 domain-containing protein [Pirellulaceae bacterium]
MIGEARLAGDEPTPPRSLAERAGRALTSRTAIELAVVFALCFMHGGDPPPAVNEAHYLTKARRFYDPAFAGPDFFLATKDAHLAFFATFGLIAAWLPLPTAAWITRSICWLVFAAGWTRLARATSLSLPASLLGCGAFLAATYWLHQSGEWVVGGAEGKSVAYGLALWGIAEWIDRRPNRCLVALGGATAFHVLVGGWTTLLILAATLVDPSRRPLLAKALPGMLLGGALSAIGVLPALALSQGVSDQALARANEIYVFERLPHHLSFAAFHPGRTLLFGILTIVVGLLLAALNFRDDPSNPRRGSMRPIVLLAIGSLILCAIGAAIDAYARVDRAAAASLLRFYWFRMADAYVPLAAALLAARLFDRQTEKLPRNLIATALFLCVAAHLGWLTVDRMQDPRSGADRQSLPIARTQDWKETCRFLRRHAAAYPEAKFLTPRRQQTFLWEAQRAELANFKNVPQDAASLLEWKRRMQDLYPMRPDGSLRPLTADDAWRLRRKYGYEFLVREKSFFNPPLPFPKVFSSTHGKGIGYEVFHIAL